MLRPLVLLPSPLSQGYRPCVRLKWKEKVSGPLAIGAGRHLASVFSLPAVMSDEARIWKERPSPRASRPRPSQEGQDFVYCPRSAYTRSRDFANADVAEGKFRHRW